MLYKYSNDRSDILSRAIQYTSENGDYKAVMRTRKIAEKLFNHKIDKSKRDDVMEQADHPSGDGAMTNGDFSCTEHSGFIARIKGLEGENKTQWDRIGKMNDKMDAIFTRLNIILGGIVVACVMLAINIAFK